MAREYRQLPLLWELQSLLELSDLTPSGLVWKQSSTRHAAGEPAGNYNPRTGYYTVFLYRIPYVAHRLVYYLRTGEDPGTADVIHKNPNEMPRDNRKELVLKQRIPTGNGPSQLKNTFIKRQNKNQKQLLPSLNSPTEFRFVANIEDLSKEELAKHGYYRGYVCVHGHTIRDQSKHWCYHCVQKINSNICGFDLNYLEPKYRNRYSKLWSKVCVGEFQDCWEIRLSINKRIKMPSYRSYYSDTVTANVTPHKLIYQCTWGDIGSGFVTRACRNPKCVNPLHLFSSWNRLHPPAVPTPFVIDFDPKKLMHSFNSSVDLPFNPIVQSQFKATIQHPHLLKNNLDYDEEQMCYVVGDGA
jgi:hypothetical protein